MRTALFTLCLGLATPAVAAAPDPTPRFERTSARESQADWMGAKGLSGAGAQLDAVAKRRLLRKVCDDLVDLRALVDAGKLSGFAFRDNVRGRSWARPTLALVLAEAMQRFSAEHPKRVLAIGDVSQPGCGQLAHGVLVQDLSGGAAAKLVEASRVELSERAVVEVKRARDFPWEADRFGQPDERVLVTTRIVAKDGTGDDTRIRTARTRHRELPAPSADETRAFEVALGRVMKGARIASFAAESEDAAGVRTSVWVSHFVAEEARQQAVVITHKRPGKKLDWADVREVRLASWQDKKPGSFPDEVRWVVERVTALPVPPKKKTAPPTPIANATFTRWALMYEAGHITHLSGIDADISYVMKADKGHFAVDVENIDVPATWRWFEIVEATAKELGTPVDAILVDASIKRHLERTFAKEGPKVLAAKKKTKVWRLLTLVGGHDAHHHLRIIEAPSSREIAARKKLGL